MIRCPQVDSSQIDEKIQIERVTVSDEKFQ